MIDTVKTSATPPHDCRELHRIIAAIKDIVPPLWPLRDYVAVNPFLGLSHDSFLNVRQSLRSVRDCDILLPHSYFRQLLEQGTLSQRDIREACLQCAEEYPELYTDLEPEDIIQLILTADGSGTTDERRFHTVSEIVDQHLPHGWTSHIINDITRHCAAHYDEGQASWSSPWHDESLYAAWRESAQLSCRMDMLGMTGFRSLVARLPASPTEAVARLLDEFDLPDSQRQDFLLCQLLSVAGWASCIRYRTGESEQGAEADDDLTGLLAIRLAYDVALAHAQKKHLPDLLDLHPIDQNLTVDSPDESTGPATEVLARYALQVAAEKAYRRTLCQSLLAGNTRKSPAERSSAQMIFCIDVRSEVLRRHLESVDSSIETFGFAGFFGMALEYIPLGESSGPAHCPVLLRPAFRIAETIPGAGEAVVSQATQNRRSLSAAGRLWKSFQTSAISCFTFVESFGLSYLLQLLSKSFRLNRPASDASRDGRPPGGEAGPGPDLCPGAGTGLSDSSQSDLAEGMLRNLGLTSHFARIVAVCGHSASVTNNPYRAGLDCGACGGHSGEPNARVAAALLNSRQVRADLARRGIHIPDDTWFVPGVHNTTTDEIRFYDTDGLPQSHRVEFARLRNTVISAGDRSRRERMQRMGNGAPEDTFRRSRDWSEVRPEWGLAGNAAFIVAPRSRTSGLNLEGRAFLHSYDYREDPDLKILELIMTAPMIVTSWISLQYYASAVDNQSFGSGNKVIHNVVSQTGVLLGNGGDLMTGLPWQSVHDGERYQHEPLRLLVIIESTRTAVQQIIDRHVMVRDLVSNGWISLAVLEEESFYRWTSTGLWSLDSDDAQLEAAAVLSMKEETCDLQAGSTK
ncbi:MAG: DUF2309 domain-containing protein [Planctomycetaceae bacterium]|nr:DUF2309 domain-containing protein [Planctomycetaceae bacterium]